MYEVFQMGDMAFLAMEQCPNNYQYFIDGCSEQQKLYLVTQICIQLCKALKYLCNKHVVHRDVWMENVMIERKPDGTLKIKLIEKKQ